MIKLAAKRGNRPIARRPGSRTVAAKKAASKLAFASRVFRVVRRLRRGETLTYGEVAKLAGSPLAYRAVGNILNKNYDPAIPCHRIIRADGRAGGYNRGSSLKRKILRMERAKHFFG